MLFVVFIHAFVGITLCIAEFICLLLLPLAVAMLEAILELACVAASILPLVLAEALGFTLRVLTNIAISVSEEV